MQKNNSATCPAMFTKGQTMPDTPAPLTGPRRGRMDSGSLLNTVCLDGQQDI